MGVHHNQVYRADMKGTLAGAQTASITCIVVKLDRAAMKCVSNRLLIRTCNVVDRAGMGGTLVRLDRWWSLQNMGGGRSASSQVSAVLPKGQILLKLQQALLIIEAHVV